MDTRARSLEIRPKESKGNTTSHLSGFRNAMYRGESRRAIKTFDDQAKKSKKELKKEEKELDKDFMEKDPKKLDVQALMEYSDKRSVLPAREAIERQEKAEHLHEARDKADLEIMQGGKKLELRIYYRDVAQDKINREDRNYHDAFNKLRYQRGRNGEFAMPMDSTEMLRMPEVSHLSDADYRKLASKLGMATPEQAKAKHTLWVEGVQGLQKEERVAKGKYGNAELRLYDGVGEHERSAMQAQSLQRRINRLEKEGRFLGAKEKELKEKLDGEEGNDDKKGLRNELMILESDGRRLGNNKERLLKQQKEIDARKDDDNYESDLRANVDAIREVDDKITKNKDETKKKEDDIRKTENEIKKVKNGIEQNEDGIKDLKDEQEKITGQDKYKADAKELKAIKDHRAGMQDKLQERQELLNKLEKYKKGEGFEVGDDHQAKIKETEEKIRDAEKEIRNKEEEFLKNNHDTGEIASKYKGMLNEKHAYEDAKEKLKEKLTSEESKPFVDAMNKTGDDFSAVYENMPWYQRDKKLDDDASIMSGSTLGGEDSDIWSVKSDSTLKEDHDTTLVDRHKGESSPDRFFDKGEVGKSLQKSAGKWLFKYRRSTPAIWLNSFGDHRQLKKEKERINKEYNIEMDRIRKNGGSIKDIKRAKDKHTYEMKIRNEDKMFRKKDYADAYAKRREGLQSGIINTDGKIAAQVRKIRYLRAHRSEYESPNWEQTKLNVKQGGYWLYGKLLRSRDQSCANKIEKLNKEFTTELGKINHQPLKESFKEAYKKAGDVWDAENVFDDLPKTPERGPRDGINYGMRREFRLRLNSLQVRAGADQGTMKIAKERLKGWHRDWRKEESKEHQLHTERARAELAFYHARDDCQDLHELIETEKNGGKDKEKIRKYEEALDQSHKNLLDYRKKVEECDKSIENVKNTYNLLQQDDATRLMEDANGLTSDDLQRAASARANANGKQGGLGANIWLDNLRDTANPNYNNNNNNGNRRNRNGFSFNGSLFNGLLDTVMEGIS